MKTLKKVLSMALVIAMAFSLVTIAGAADTVSKYQDFTDASDIANKEAVDTLTALGIINGMGDGSFAPKGTFTRAQAAKIIAYMLLGATSADNLKASVAPFNDVAASHWSAAYIQYCSIKGIINGLGDGNFNPEGEVTAAQFAKMLLTAIGYGKLGEYVGNDWAINAIVDAQNLGILDTNVDYMAPATRDEVARYAFNAFTNDKCYFVVMNKDTDGYQAAAGSSAGTLAAQQKVTNNEDADTVVGGLVSRQWFKNNAQLTGNWFALEDQKVLATSVAGTDLATLSNPASASYVASADNDVSYYLNGTDSTSTEVETAIASGAASAVVKLIDTNKNNRYDVVSVVERAAYEVVATSTVSAAGRVTIPGTLLRDVEKDLIDGPVNFVKGDVVIVSAADSVTGKIVVEKAKKVQGQMVSGNAKMVTFAGGMYFGAAGTAAISGKDLATFAGVANLAGNLNKNATAYVDSYNYIVSIKLDDASSSSLYALVLGYDFVAATSTRDASANIRVLLQDGTMKVYAQASEANGTVTDLGSITGTLVNYFVTEDGKLSVSVPTTSTTPKATPATLTADYGAKDNYVTTDAGTYYLTTATKVFYLGGSYPTDRGAVTIGTAKTVDIDITNDSDDVFIVTSSADNVADAILFRKTVTTLSTDIQYAFSIWGAGDASSGTARAGARGTTLIDYSAFNGDVGITLTTFLKADGTADKALPAGLFAYTLNERGQIAAVHAASATGNEGAFKPTATSSVIDDTGAEDVHNFAYADITYIDPAGAFFVFNDDWNGTGWTTKAVLTNENTKYFNVDKDVNKIPFNTITTGGLNTSSTSGAAENGVHFKVLGWVVDKEGVATDVYYTYLVD